jgi:hypothetical protein
MANAAANNPFGYAHPSAPHAPQPMPPMPLPGMLMQPPMLPVHPGMRHSASAPAPLAEAESAIRAMLNIGGAPKAKTDASAALRTLLGVA